MALSRFGKHLDERLASTSKKPANPPTRPRAGILHNEGDRWWRHGASGWELHEPTDTEKQSYFVSQEVERLEFNDSVGGELQKTLHRAMKGVGWRSVTVEYELARDVYIVRGEKIADNYRRKIQAVTHFIHAEKLARATVDLKTYQEFIGATTNELMKLMATYEGPVTEPMIEGRGSTYEATGRARGFLSATPHRLADDAVTPFSWVPAEDELVREEREAIESIKRTLNARPES